MALVEERDDLKHVKTKYEQAQREVNDMLIESQANKDEIKELYDTVDQKVDETEKMKLELTVVTTEKVAQKKELERIM